MPSGNTADPASVIWRSESKFDQWAESICLNRELHQDLPEELQRLLEASRKFPAWLGDPNAAHLKPYRGIFAAEIGFLQRYIPRPTTDIVNRTDAETTDHLYLALPHILKIPNTHDYLLSETVQACGQPNEADMRISVDQLLNHVWHKKGVLNFAHCLERKLQLPKSNSKGATPVSETISNSIVLFWHPGDTFRRLFQGRLPDKPARSCLARVHMRAVLHWAIEYKQDEQLAVSRRTMMAMVSGLYQRRALGCMDHFVFGTAHSGDYLDVFAGRWELVKSSAGQATGASPAEKDVREGQDKGTTPPENHRSTLRSSNKPPSGSTSNLPKKDEYEIKIYRLPRYSLLSPLDMIEFYMLMRASRDLAHEYAADIFSDRYEKVHNLPVESCTWPADPRDSSERPTTRSNSRANSEHQGALGTIPEVIRVIFLSEHYDNEAKGGFDWFDQLRRQPSPEPDQKVLEFLDGLDTDLANPGV